MGKKEEVAEEVALFLFSVDFIMMRVAWCANCGKVADQGQSLVLLEVRMLNTFCVSLGLHKHLRGVSLLFLSYI